MNIFRKISVAAAVAAVMASATAASAQKKITPVDTDPTKPPQPVLHYYDKHGTRLRSRCCFLQTSTR